MSNVVSFPSRKVPVTLEDRFNIYLQQKIGMTLAELVEVMCDADLPIKVTLTIDEICSKEEMRAVATNDVTD